MLRLGWFGARQCCGRCRIASTQRWLLRLLPPAAARSRTTSARPLRTHLSRAQHSCRHPRTRAAALTQPIVAAWPDGRQRATYHDVRWNEAAGLLYAAGKDKVIDVYAMA